MSNIANPPEFIKNFIRTAYENALVTLGSFDKIQSNLPEDIKLQLNIILEHSEKAKAVLTVILTSLTYKQLNPNQDIRKLICPRFDGHLLT